MKIHCHMSYPSIRSRLTSTSLLSRRLSLVLRFSVFLSFVLSFCLTAHAQAPAPSAADLFWRDIVKSGAIKDYPTGLKTLTREIKIYHYFNLEKVWPELETPEGRLAYTKRYLDAVTKRFWDLNFHADQYINAGPGLYLAIDPHVSSKDFGSTMLQMTIPAGASYLSVVRSIPLMPDTIQAIKNEGLVSESKLSKLFVSASKQTSASSAFQYGIPMMKKLGAPYGFYRETLRYMTDAEFETFRRFVMSVLAQHGVQLIEFNWKSSLRNFCSSSSQSAFNYIGVPPGGTQAPAFTETLPMVSSLNFPALSPFELATRDWVLRLRSAAEEAANLQAAGRRPAKGYTFGYSPDEYKQVKSQTFECR